MKTFEVKGWEEMKNILETGVITALASVVSVIGDINNAIDSVGSTFEDVFGAGGGAVQVLADFAVALTGPLGLIKDMVKYTKMLTGAGKGDAKSENVKSVSDYYKGVFDKSENKTAAYSEITNKLYRALNREFKKNGKSENYNRLKEIIQIVDDYMNDYLSGFGVTKSTIKPTIIPKNPNAAKDVKEKSIEDIINEQFPDIAQAESEGQSYGEQLMQSILVGMAEKAQEADKNTLKNLMEVVVKNGIEGVDIPADELMSKIIGDGADIPDETWQKLQDEINAKLAEMGIEPIKINFETGNLEKVVKDTKTTTKEWHAAATAISAVGNAMQQIEDPAAKILGTIGQAIATVAMAYSESLAKDKTTKGNIWAFIAAAAAATVSMATTIASIHSSTGYASGGVIKGNSYSGDNIGGLVDGNQLVGLNSGEMVLNRFQQQALAGTLEGGGIKNISISGRLQGEDIVLSIDRWGRRTGKGELLFAKNL